MSAIRVAYIMGRFPKLTETFVLLEILAVERQGVTVGVHPLVRERGGLQHPEAAPLVARARYLPWLSWPIVRSNLHWLRTSPRAYGGALWALLRGTWGSRRFFLGALALFPKTAHAARLMVADGVDHVHCHFASHPAAAGFLVWRLTGIPFSFTAHGSDLHVDRHMLREKVAEAAFVVTVSEYNRRLILDECPGTPPDHVVVVHCGVDTAAVTPAAARGDGGPLTVLCVGTMHEVKGQRHLIEACRLLRDQGVAVRAVLVGGGPDLEALERQVAAAGLDGTVQVLGQATRPQVLAHLRAADVLVAPSVPTRQGKREGIPVALMEGMAAGLPVVASRLSGIPELVEDGASGLLVPPGDPTALAAALRTLAQDPELRHRLATAGRARVLADFDLHRSAAELAHHFTAATGRPGAGGEPVARSLAGGAA